MSDITYTILHKDEETKNIVLRITNTERAGILLDVTLDEWVSEENLDTKLRQDVLALQTPVVNHTEAENPQEEENI
ncbi:hypothetical protein N8457_00185 [bacterium]|jgi:hypothetical protein|nr:hypothetical protein [bacterium]